MFLSYKRYISIFLIIMILFNFAGSIKVKAAEPITLTTVGLVFFAMAITALGISIINSEDFYILFNDFIDYLKELSIDLGDFLSSAYNALINLIKTGMFEIGSYFEKILDWILLRNFGMGENSLTLGEGLIFDKEFKINVYEDKKVESIPYTGTGIYKIDITILDEYDNVEGEVTLILDIKESRVFSWIDYNVYTLPNIDLYNRAELYFNGNLLDLNDWDVFRFDNYYDISRVIQMDARPEYFREVQKISFDTFLGRLRLYTEGIEGDEYGSYDFKQALGEFIYDDYSWLPSIPIPEPYVIPYKGYGGVLESDEYPSFPVPATVPIPDVYYPGVYENEDGNIVYPGTPEGFIGALDTKYVDDWLKKIAGKEGLGSIPGVVPKVREGIIEFPTTEEVENPPWDIPIDSPWDIPIDVPENVPVPADVPTGLGVIGWLLKYIAQGITGIWNLLKELFSSPTKTINFDSLMNLNVKDKFPFSLPWDLYNSVSLIAVPAQVPQFELKIKNASIEINFSQFEALAAISRVFTTLIYTISLVMISRRLIGGE